VTRDVVELVASFYKMDVGFPLFTGSVSLRPFIDFKALEEDDMNGFTVHNERWRTGKLKPFNLGLTKPPTDEELHEHEESVRLLLESGFSNDEVKTMSPEDFKLSADRARTCAANKVLADRLQEAERFNRALEEAEELKRKELKAEKKDRNRKYKKRQSQRESRLEGSEETKG
jgi:hypothetical protein